MSKPSYLITVVYPTPKWQDLDMTNLSYQTGLWVELQNKLAGRWRREEDGNVVRVDYTEKIGCPCDDMFVLDIENKLNHEPGRYFLGYLDKLQDDELDSGILDSYVVAFTLKSLKDGSIAYLVFSVEETQFRKFPLRARFSLNCADTFHSATA